MKRFRYIGEPNFLGFGSKNQKSLLLDKFIGAGDEVAITRNDLSGGRSGYQLAQHLGDGMYWVLKFAAQTLTPTDNTPMLDVSQISRIIKWFNFNTVPAMTSFAWAHSDVASYMGGETAYDNNTDSWAQIVFPANTTWIGAEITKLTNGCLAVVSIDGDKTLADLLPTAQDVVNSGDFPNTILVANGGTLNPTDRVLDYYASPNVAVYQFWFSKSLSAASHTVRITNTGYKRAASSGIYQQIHCFYAYGPSFTKTTDSNYYLLLEPDQVMMSESLVWEVSWNVIPTGATLQEWIGHSGSMKFKSLAVTVDGVPDLPAAEETITGIEIVLTIQSSVRNAEIDGGATEIGVLNMIYTINATTGLTINHDLTWALGGVRSPSYPCMCAVVEIMDRGRADGEPIEILTDNDNSFKCKTSKFSLFAWDFDGYMAIAFSPDAVIACNNWIENADDQTRFYWKDMATYNKAYVLPKSAGDNYSASDVWYGQANYRVGWFPNGANAEMA